MQGGEPFLKQTLGFLALHAILGGLETDSAKSSLGFLDDLIDIIDLEKHHTFLRAAPITSGADLFGRSVCLFVIPEIS